eukprot:TRINITY_DN3326_c0_g2_i1.p1 TRINITY_DN3326_c0_g2~~TRINITY_DN3326_c0_g2_i1.p1  ORF type:complete len:890 (+),score=188.52 TRINITY_DN3326_c0_g2_i1:138-2672(+)
MSKSEAVKVMIRVRPFNSRERKECGDDEYPMSIVYMHPDNEKVDVLAPDGSIEDTYEFGKAFWSIPESQKQICSKPFADQEAVFEQMGISTVDSALEGYHSCIFAYGQTGSGKTYTMLGSPTDPGVAPKLVDHLFHKLEKSNKRGWKYEIDLSFMEIYNEKVKDLLLEISSPKRRKSSKTPGSPGSPKKDQYAALKVRQDKLIGVHVVGLTRLGKNDGMVDAESVKRVMKFGMEHRAVAETKMNATSSRSHAVFQLCITAKNTQKGVNRYSHINIVDLAGSEKISMSGAQGATLIEATRINLSLTTLRRVIDALIQNATAKNKVLPPYRDSMLTYILSESLGGNSNTMMLATISPSEMNREDTINTLRYAMKAKSIVNTVRKNEQQQEAKVGHFAAEINALRQQLVDDDPDVQEYEDMKEDLERKKTAMNAEMQKMAKSRQEMEDRKQSIVAASRRKTEVEDEFKALKQEGLEEKHRIHEEQTRVQELETQRIRDLQAEVAQRDAEAAAKLEEEARVKAELEVQKKETIETHAALRTDMNILNKKKFALAFKKAFMMRKVSDNKSHVVGQISYLNDEITSGEEKIKKLEEETIKIQMHTRSMEADIRYSNDKCEEIETSTKLHELQETADTIRKACESLDTENNILLEQLSELRIKVGTLERSKANAVERLFTKQCETNRKTEMAKSVRIRMEDSLKSVQRELSDVRDEVRHSRTLKEKARTGADNLKLRKERMIMESRELSERNEALQLALDTNMNQLSTETRRLQGLHQESKPLNDEMRFKKMLLQLGYGRVAAAGGRTATRPVPFNANYHMSPPSPVRSSSGGVCPSPRSSRGSPPLNGRM